MPKQTDSAPKQKAALRLPAPPDPGVWESAVHLVPEVAGSEPDLISDGGGLPFTREAAFAEPGEPLSPEDPTVIALLAQIDGGRQLAMPRRPLRPRAKPAPISVERKLEGWRVLARSDEELLFGCGKPPRLLTVAVKRVGRGKKWQPLGASNARPLRAFRDGARASLWRIDPNFPPTSQCTELRVLLTEISKAAGTMPDDRLLTPEIHLSDKAVTVRLYVEPLSGYVAGTKRHETPVVIELPEPLGARLLRDGGPYNPAA